MKRTGQLIAKIAEPDNLRLAFWKARKGKDGQEEVECYRDQLDINLLELRTQILSANVEVGDYHYFTIRDPKERIICAASFPERVLHHALMNICDQPFEDYQIYDSYATRRGKGTYAALHRAEHFHKNNRWFLKLDVRKYFDNIDHEILKQLLERRFKDHGLLQIFGQIIDSYHVVPGKGVPIGNLTSQYFANYYLACADRYIKQQLRIKAYVRYMDDMILWSNDKAQLQEAGRQVQTFLEEKLGLQLKIMLLNRSSHGLTFVGYRIFDTFTGLSPRSKRRFVKKMKEYHHKLQQGDWSQQEYQQHVLPLLAFAQHASTLKLRQRVLRDLGDLDNFGQSSGAQTA